MLVKVSRQKAKENQKKKKEAIKEMEASMEKMGKQLELFKKYIAFDNAIQNKDPAIFEVVKKQLEEKKII